MDQSGSTINIANIILALVVPIVSAAVAHRLAHERAMRDTARQLFADVLRNTSRHRHATGRLRIFYQMVHDQNLPEALQQLAFEQINELSTSVAEYVGDLGAIAAVLPMIFGKKANKVVQILSDYLAPIPTENVTDADFDKAFARFDELRGVIVPELNRLNRSLTIAFIDDDG